MNPTIRPRSRFSPTILLAMIVLPTIAQAEIFVQPYLQNPTADGISVLWWTDESQPESSFQITGMEGADIKAGPPVKASNEFVWEMGKWLHIARLKGLAAGTYLGEARSEPFTSKKITFKPALPKPEQGLSVAILGDGRTDNDAVIARHRALVERASKNADLIFEIGDMIHYGSSEQWWRFLQRVIPAVPVAYQMAVGNHELYLHQSEAFENNTTSRGYETPAALRAAERFRTVVDNPPNGASNGNWEERYYAMRVGCVAFLVLDTNNTSDDKYDNHKMLADGATPDWHPGSEQYRWLEKQLADAQRTATFTIVMMHPSPYSRGKHGSPADKQSGYHLRVLDPLLRRYEVDAIISSHDHTVEHCLTGPQSFDRKMDTANPQNLNYIVIGNSGQASRQAAKAWPTWMSIHRDAAPPLYSRWFYPWAGRDDLASYIELTIPPAKGTLRTATFTVVRNDGETFPLLEISRPSPRQSDNPYKR
jgi:hypothetical protein